MTEEEINVQLILELRELLKKYNACISFSVGSCSDTHGLYDEKMVVSRQPDPAKWEEIDVIHVDGYSLDHTDFKSARI